MNALQVTLEHFHMQPTFLTNQTVDENGLSGRLLSDFRSRFGERRQWLRGARHDRCKRLIDIADQPRQRAGLCFGGFDMRAHDLGGKRQQRGVGRWHAAVPGRVDFDVLFTML